MSQNVVLHKANTFGTPQQIKRTNQGRSTVLRVTFCGVCPFAVSESPLATSCSAQPLQLASNFQSNCSSSTMNRAAQGTTPSIIINRTMFIRSTCSLGLMAFSRPISILARTCNVPQVRAASARLGMHIHKCPSRPFHSSIRTLKQSQDKDTASSKPSTKTTLPPTNLEKQSAQAQAPTNDEIERFIPGFSNLGVDAKLAHIQILKSLGKNDPKWKPGPYEALTMKEKEIQDADRWYKQAFRSIAWGPTILINAIIAMIWF